MQAEVFPSYAARMALAEVELERDDDRVISAMQDDLLTRCLCQVLRGAAVRCAAHRRKYLSKQDVEYALATTAFAVSTTGSVQQGRYLLDAQVFEKFCESHLSLVATVIVGEATLRVSKAVLVVVQEATERLIRGFLERVREAVVGQNVSFRAIDRQLTMCAGGVSEEAFERV